MADSDLNNWYGSMHASNNHHLQDKHADMYSDPHTAFLKGHEAVGFLSSSCDIHIYTHAQRTQDRSSRPRGGVFSARFVCVYMCVYVCMCL